MASFEAFEQKELQRHRSGFWWELGLLLLLSLIAITLIAKLGNHNWFTQSQTLDNTAQTHSTLLSDQDNTPDIDDKTSVYKNDLDRDETQLVATQADELDEQKDVRLIAPINNKDRSKTTSPGKNLFQDPRDINDAFNDVNKSHILDEVGLLEYWGLRYKLINQTDFSKAQKPETGFPTHKEGKLEVWTSFGSNFSTVSVENVDTNYIHRQFRQIYQEGKNVGLSPYINVGIEYALSRNLNLNLGLGFSQQKLKGKYDFTLREIPVYDLDGTIGGYFTDSSQGSTQFETSSRFNYLELPLRINYRFALRTWDGQIGMGLNSSYLLSVKGDAIDPYMLNEVRSEDIAEYNRFTADLNLRFAAYRSLFGNLSAGFEFQVNQSLMGRYKSDILQANAQTLRLGLLLKYSIPTLR
ncbi:PorT family protein [bacterium]|nr:PorT family protein [bacterium]